MKINKLDNRIQNKLKNRTFQPSSSAWDRLSVQLDAQSSSKKRLLGKYFQVAVSIVLFFTIGRAIFLNSTDTTTLDKKIVQQHLAPELEKTPNISIEKNEITIAETTTKKVQKNPELQKKNSNPSQQFITKENSGTPKNVFIVKNKQTLEMAITEKKFEEIAYPQEIIAKTPKASIHVNSRDLLYAVTHSQSEIDAYYAKNNTDRQTVFKTIEQELYKANLTVDPNTILAEVERTLLNDGFENNFLKSLKKNISSLATAVASRNEYNSKN